MKTVGKFKITGSFKIIGRGLTAMGEIIEGKITVGNFTTFNVGTKEVTLKIARVAMGGNRSTGTFYVGLTFAYKDQNERMELESLKLKEQVIEIKSE